MFCSRNTKPFQKKKPIHSSSISWLRSQSFLLTFPVCFYLQICIHSSTSVMAAITVSFYAFYYSHLIKMNCIAALSAIELTIQNSTHFISASFNPKKIAMIGSKDFTQTYNKTTCRHEALTISNFIQKLEGKQKECILQDQLFA